MKKILIVEDDPVTGLMVKKILENADFETCLVTTAEDALTEISSFCPGVVLTDIQLPGISGFDLCNKLMDTSNSTARIICMSGLTDVDTGEKCYNLGAVGFLRKPFNNRELVAIARMAANKIRYVGDVQNTVEALLLALESKDLYTSGHSKNVARISFLIGQALGLNDKELHQLIMACHVHDIGKIGISDEILNKPGKLTDLEFEEIKKHPTEFQTITNSVNLSDESKCGAADHHEKFDGSGYPFGKQHGEIHPWGEIMAIADVYDALTSERSYKLAWTHADAIKEIHEKKGSHFNPAFVDVFMRISQEKQNKHIFN